MRQVPMFCLLLLLGACAGGPMASPQDDRQAKRFDPPARDKGALYVYRREVMGFARPIDVAIAGGANARLPIDTYLRLEGPAGPIEVDCKVGDKVSSVQVEIDDGRTRYVEVSMVTGWSPGCRLAEVPPDEGQAAVRASRRVEPL